MLSSRGGGGHHPTAQTRAREERGDKTCGTSSLAGAAAAAALPLPLFFFGILERQAASLFLQCTQIRMEHPKNAGERKK